MRAEKSSLSSVFEAVLSESLFRERKKGSLRKGVFVLQDSLESLNSLESLDNSRILLCFPQSGDSLESLEPLKSLEMDFLKRPLFQKNPFSEPEYSARFRFWSVRFRKLEKAVAVRNSLLERFSGKFRRCWKMIPRFSGSAKCYPFYTVQMDAEMLGRKLLLNCRTPLSNC